MKDWKWLGHVIWITLLCWQTSLRANENAAVQFGIIPEKEWVEQHRRSGLFSHTAEILEVLPINDDIVVVYSDEKNLPEQLVSLSRFVQHQEQVLWSLDRDVAQSRILASQCNHHAVPDLLFSYWLTLRRRCVLEGHIANSPGIHAWGRAIHHAVVPEGRSHHPRWRRAPPPGDDMVQDQHPHR